MVVYTHAKCHDTMRRDEMYIPFPMIWLASKYITSYHIGYETAFWDY